MFKVFRIKEEHSAFLSDGGGIGSRGLASVRPHHASLFLLSPTVCLSFPPLFFLSFSVLLFMFTVSHFISLPLPLFFFDLLSLSVAHSTSLGFLLSLFLSPCFISPHLTSSHPSISSLPHRHYPSGFIVYTVFYLPPSLHPSTCASISPPSLSFPMEAHKADGYSNRL